MLWVCRVPSENCTCTKYNAYSTIEPRSGSNSLRDLKKTYPSLVQFRVDSDMNLKFFQSTIQTVTQPNPGLNIQNSDSNHKFGSNYTTKFNYQLSILLLYTVLYCYQLSAVYCCYYVKFHSFTHNIIHGMTRHTH